MTAVPPSVSESDLVQLLRDLALLDPIGDYGCGDIGCLFCSADYGSGPSFAADGSRVPIEHDPSCVWRRASLVVAWADDPIFGSGELPVTMAGDVAFDVASDAGSVPVAHASNLRPAAGPICGADLEPGDRVFAAISAEGRLLVDCDACLHLIGLDVVTRIN